jgi:hypothetical protein
VIEDTSAKLSWNLPGIGSSGGKNVGIIHYNVYYVEGNHETVTDYNELPWQPILATPAKVTNTASAVITGLTRGKTYTFMVIAENSFGRSSRGATAAATGIAAEDILTLTTADGKIVPSKYVYKQADKKHAIALRANSSNSLAITYSVDKPAIAKVNSASGELTFTGTEGKVTVTARTTESTVKATINVVRNVTSIGTPLKALQIAKKKSVSIPIVIYDVAAEIKPVLTWSTSNKKVATVDKNGKVKAAKKIKKKATVTIKGVAANGKSVSVKVTVLPKASKVTKFKAKAPKTLKVNKSAVIKLSKVSKKAGVTKISFKSSKAKGLYVDKAGKLTAKKKGKYTITVTVGSKKQKIKVQVK